MKRRSFLKFSGLLGGAFLVEGTILSFITGCSKSGMGISSSGGINGIAFNNILPIPNVVGSSVTLTAQQTLSKINGNSISVLGYQANSILGPTIKVNNGAAVNVILQNKLSENNNIHWHGVKVPSTMDGYPTDVAKANSTFNYQFVVNQRAGLYWYHPHTDGLTSKQAYLGLAGVFMVNDQEETALNLPSGQFEIPLVIQDKRISNNALDYSPTAMETMTGYFGDTITVNGETGVYTTVGTCYYRFRILNGSNARIYNLALSNNLDIVVIGNDAGLLKNPITVKSILLAPGERLDVLINFAGIAIGTEIYLESKTFSGAGSAQGTQSFNILKFKVNQNIADTFSLPNSLSVITPINAATAIKTRNFDITNASMIMNGAAMAHTINGKSFDANRVDETVTANTTEIWVFDNSKGDEPHPMHIHAVQFQVLERKGGRNQLIASETNCWKDTVLVLPGEIVKVIVPFENYKGKFVFHCHNLEHEDNGMMLQYQLV